MALSPAALLSQFVPRFLSGGTTKAALRAAIGGDYVIERQNAVASPGVELTLPEGFDAFELKILNYKASIAIDASLRISYDGATFDAASNYLTFNSFGVAGAAPGAPFSTTTSFFRFLSVDPPSGDVTNSIATHIISPGGAGQSFRMEGSCGGFSQGNAAMTQYRTSCVKQGETGRAKKIAILAPGGGLITGLFILKGIGG